MKKNIKSYVLLAIVGVLVVSSVVVTIETATTGLEMARLEKEERELVRQKSELEESLVKTLSLGELHEKSESLGFNKPEDLVYVLPGESVAKLP